MSEDPEGVRLLAERLAALRGEVARLGDALVASHKGHIASLERSQALLANALFRALGSAPAGAVPPQTEKDSAPFAPAEAVGEEPGPTAREPSAPARGKLAEPQLGYVLTSWAEAIGDKPLSAREALAFAEAGDTPEHVALGRALRLLIACDGGEGPRALGRAIRRHLWYSAVGLEFTQWDIHKGSRRWKVEASDPRAKTPAKVSRTDQDVLALLRRRQVGLPPPRGGEPPAPTGAP